jgi:hypothetical protein
VGGADGLIHEAETSVRNVAIVRLIADPAYRAVYAAHAAGGARVSAEASVKLDTQRKAPDEAARLAGLHRDRRQLAEGGPGTRRLCSQRAEGGDAPKPDMTRTLSAFRGMERLSMSEPEWPVQILPSRGGRDPVALLANLLAPEGDELAERRKLAEQVIASVRKHDPDNPMLNVRRTPGEPGFSVSAGGRAQPVRGGPSAEIAQAPTLTRALQDLINRIA